MFPTVTGRICLLLRAMPGALLKNDFQGQIFNKRCQQGRAQVNSPGRNSLDTKCCFSMAVFPLSTKQLSTGWQVDKLN